MKKSPLKARLLAELPVHRIFSEMLIRCGYPRDPWFTTDLWLLYIRPLWGDLP